MRKLLNGGSVAASPDTSIGSLAHAASRQASNITVDDLASAIPTPSADGAAFSISTAGSASAACSSRARHGIDERKAGERLREVRERTDVARRAPMHRIVMRRDDDHRRGE